jgi:hypothetical protein
MWCWVITFMIARMVFCWTVICWMRWHPNDSGMQRCRRPTDAPAEVSVVLQEFAGFGGAGFELVAHLLDESFVGGFFGVGEDERLAGEAVDRGVGGTALEALGGLESSVSGICCDR